MITKKFKNIFLISIILLIAHGIEELATGMYNVDRHVEIMFSFVKGMTPTHAAFLVFQIMIWLILIVSYLMILGPKWQLRLLVIPGLIFVYELEHIYMAISVGGYYPGLITAVLFPVVGFFYWKELIKTFKNI
jgi:hypothetical protein